MYFKKVLDLGCGQADISGALYRLGADVLAVDARQEHLQTAGKKFPGLKTVKADLDREWPFGNRKFDIVLDLGLLPHIRDYEAHLRAVCASTTHLILETAVCDSTDPNKNVTATENKNIYDLSVNGVSSRPTAAAIERVLTECGMNFRRLDQSKFNAGPYVYDWLPKNDDDCNIYKRRIWFAVKNSSPIQFAPVSPSPNIVNSPKHSFPPPHTYPSSIYSRNTSRAVQHYVPPAANLSVPQMSGDKKFVIVIPSYKNQAWCIQNITSCLNQNYSKYRVLFTDDCSPDETFDKVKAVVDASPKASKCTIVKNTHRIGALANLYNMIHSCDDDEIILTLDGDDWFPHEHVLSRLNEIYSREDIWMTYGQYQNHPDRGTGVAQPYPQNVVDANGFRGWTWGATHLRTFYAWLFKQIKKDDLIYNGDFYPMTWDFAMMFPMLEMSGNHSRFVSDILYVYNMENPINDHKVNVQLQQNLDRHIRGLARYQRVQKPVTRNVNVGLLLIATGKYHKFIQGMISSADRYFLNNGCDVTYYVFTDNPDNGARSPRKIIYIPTEHKPFPYASMDRFKHFINHTETLKNEDYLFYADVDSMFVDFVSNEILGNLVGVRHCGYYNKYGPYEHNPSSCLFVPENYPKRYKYYFGGGFSGGRRHSYLELAKWCSEKIEQDVSRGIIPVWHDETALNRYFLEIEPDIVLSPSYHYPQSNIEGYKRQWSPDRFEPKILLLDKNHHEVRT